MTILRLPDQFSPNAVGATAATPTCCCCCCSCAVSSVSTLVALPMGLIADLRQQEKADPPVAPKPFWQKVAGIIGIILAPIILTIALIAGAVFFSKGGLESAWWFALLAWFVGIPLSTTAVATLVGVRQPRWTAIRTLIGLAGFSIEFIGAIVLLAGAVSLASEFGSAAYILPGIYLAAVCGSVVGVVFYYRANPWW